MLLKHIVALDIIQTCCIHGVSIANRCWDASFVFDKRSNRLNYELWQYDLSNEYGW